MLARAPSRAADDDRDALLATCPMVGDINLFLSEQYDEKDADAPPHMSGELNVMIAVDAYRRQGLASEALRLLFHYVTARPTPLPHGESQGPSPLMLDPTHIFARIHESNAASRALFEELGFVVGKESNVFSEMELQVVDASSMKRTAPRAVLFWPETGV